MKTLATNPNNARTVKASNTVLKILIAFTLLLGITVMNVNAQRSNTTNNSPKPSMTVLSNFVSVGEPIEIAYTHSDVHTIKFTVTNASGWVMGEISYRLERGTHIIAIPTNGWPSGRIYTVTTLNDVSQDTGQEQVQVGR